jgi:hypothetical protein
MKLSEVICLIARQPLLTRKDLAARYGRAVRTID